jgi:dihydroflavonol-4-reductase
VLRPQVCENSAADLPTAVDAIGGLEMNHPQHLTLVTGGSGFVGNNLVRYLLSLNRRVRVLCRSKSRSLAGLDVDVVTGDVLDAEQLDRAMAGVEVVYHLAAVVSIDRREDRSRMRRVNVEGTRRVVAAAIRNGVRRFVHLGSVHALSYTPRDQPIDESRKLAHQTDRHGLPYDISKADGQRIVTAGVQRGLDAVILNPVGIIGPFDFHPSAAGEMLLQLMERRLPGLVRAGYYWVDSRDVATAAVAAERQGKTGEHYIIKGEYATFARIADYVHQITGTKPPKINVPVWTARGAAPMIVWLSRFTGRRPLVTPESVEIISRHQNIQTDKAERELGFQHRPLQTTISDKIAWFQQHQMTTSTKRAHKSS